MKRKKLLSLFLAVVMVISTVAAMGIQIGATLLPIKTVWAKAELSGYDEEELKNMPLGTILDKMEPEYSDEAISIDPESAVLIVDDDVYEEADRDTLIDLSDSGYSNQDGSSYSKRLTLVIGSGKQLDPDNIHYEIDVKVQNKYTSNVEFTFYTIEGTEKKIIPAELLKDENGVLYGSNTYSKKSYNTKNFFNSDDVVYVEAKAELIDNATGEIVSADSEFTYRFNLNEDENGRIFESRYISSDYADDFIDIVYSTNGKTLLTDRCHLALYSAIYNIDSQLTDTNGNKVEAYTYKNGGFYSVWHEYEFNDESELDKDYLLFVKKLFVHSSKDYDEDGSSLSDLRENVVKAVDGGFFESIEETEDKKDIKDQLFNSGYKVNLSESKYFTLFVKDESDNENVSIKTVFFIVEGGVLNSSSNINIGRYDGNITIPVPAGRNDPWFRLRSASAEGYTLSARTMDYTDTYYSYGYQTMFIYPKKNEVEEETTTTEEETTASEEITTSSEAETTTPESETTTPESEATTPESETTTPESETTTPESEATTPESETTAPESEATTPESEATTSEAETTTPESETTTPEAANSTPESETEDIQGANEAYAAETEQDEAGDSALSSLMLNVYTNGVNIYDSVSGAPVDFKKDPQDFTAGTVQYTVAMEEDNNKTKNYFISIVQPVAGGAKLYVNGPEEREVYFDDYFDERHDILIANIGDEPLTGLSAELIGAENVKLDSYWNIGGEKNDTLQAFTSASSYEMANLAKIRLVPDGEGEVKGTLKITADGQEPVLISLIGHAGNPKIVTESPLKDAVKYVPYRAIIANDNIHKWNTVTYSYYGNLPIGVTFNRENGEIYGTPQETGTFTFHVYPICSSDYFSTSYTDFELTVLDNTNDNVFNATDENYEIKTFLGREATAGAHDYVLGKVAEDQLFVSNGEFGNFIDLWLNGQRLEKDTDYSVEEGSTRIVIFDEVFDGLEDNDNNTIAAEFREGANLNDDLKRTAQNFKIDVTYTEPINPDNPDNPDFPGTSGGSTSGSFGTPDNGGDNQGSGNQDSGNGGEDNTGSDNSGVPENPANNGNSDNNGTADKPGENQSESDQSGDVQNASGSVNISASVTDINGSALAGLSVELHSDVKTAVTDESGKFAINSAEFGSHTLILKDEAKGIYAEKKFDLVKGSAFEVTDEAVTAPDGALISLNMVVDGNTVRFVQTSGVTSDAGNVNGANEDKAVPTGAAFPVCVAAAALSAMGLIVLNIKKRN